MERRRRSSLMLDLDLDKQIKESYHQSGEREKEGHGQQVTVVSPEAPKEEPASAGSPLDDFEEPAAEFPKEPVRKATLRAARKRPARKSAEETVKGERTLKISEDMHYVLVYEKARLNRAGVDVYSFGSLVQNYFFEYLRKHEKEAYATYQAMGLIK